MLSKKEMKAIAIVVGVVVIGIGVGMYRSFSKSSLEMMPLSVPTENAGSDAAAEVELIQVHVSGAVARPGVYELPKKGRALSAIQLAGGFLPMADLDRVNLAQKLKDGQRISVPFLKEKKASKRGMSDDVSKRVLINQASAEELMFLPRMTPKTAQAIVKNRQIHGPFHSPADLLKVKGVTKKKAVQWEERLVFE